MNPKVFVAMAAAAAYASVARGEDGTIVDGFQAYEDPWDCQQTNPDKSGEAPTPACQNAYPAEWFISRTDVDLMCKAENCMGATGKAPGCLLIASRFKAVDPPDTYKVATRFCADQTSMGTPDAIGLIEDRTAGTPSDPFGRCTELNEYFGGSQEEPPQIYVWCGDADERPATTTKDPSLCECDGCSPGSSGQCKYNGDDGPKISFTNLCAPYYDGGTECFSGFDAGSEVEVEDCCVQVSDTTKEPLTSEADAKKCPEKYCNKGAGPCIYDYKDDGSGASICLDYMYQGDLEGNGAMCYPQSSKCKGPNGLFEGEEPDTVATAVTTTAKATQAPSNGGCPPGENYCDEYCDQEECYGDTKGPCRSAVPAPCRTGDTACIDEDKREYLCLPYLQGTDRLRDLIDETNEDTGPQCLSYAVKCKKWTTSTITSSTSTTTTVTTSTITSTTVTTTARSDPSAESLARKELNALVDAWESIYCSQPGDAEKVAQVNGRVLRSVKAINEGMIRAWMTKGYHTETQAEMKEERLPQVVGEGLGEKFCAGPNEECSCNGLVRRSVVPAVSWGTFNCSAETFESVTNAFEPALNNPDGNCYCTALNVERLEGVASGKDLFELARMVGASRMCKAGKNFNQTNDKKDYIDSGCSAMCRGHGDIKKMGDLQSMLTDHFGAKANEDQRREFFETKVEELQDMFDHIFRLWKNDEPTNYNSYVVSAVSDGGEIVRSEHMAYLDGVRWSQYRVRSGLNRSANEKFATAADGLDSEFLAIGQRQSASTQVGCPEGGIKQVLGICECAKTAALTTTTTQPPTLGPETTTSTSTSTSTGTGTSQYTCVPGQSGYMGPMVGKKISSALQDPAEDAEVISQIVDKSVKECAETCATTAACKEFGYRASKKINATSGSVLAAGSKCLLYDYALSTCEPIAKCLRSNSPYDHYFFSEECTEAPTTTPPTAATTTVPTTGTTVATTFESGVAKPSDRPVILGAQCLAAGVDQLGICEEKCAAQHECSGVMYFFEPNDNKVHCENMRLTSRDSAGNDAFDHFKECVKDYDPDNKDEEYGCADDESAFPGPTNGTYTCEKCLSDFVKKDKCDALYQLSPTKEAAAGVVAKPVKACVMLTALCADGSDACIRYDLDGLVEADSMRAISLKKKIISEDHGEPDTDAPPVTTTAKATSGDDTPYLDFDPNKDPWDCQQMDPDKSGEAPSTACQNAYPAEWFISRTEIDQMCNAEKCMSDPSTGRAAGCVIVSSRFKAIDPPDKFEDAIRFCADKEYDDAIGLIEDRTAGTPSDPLGRCNELNEYFGGSQESPPQMYVWCGDADERPATTTAKATQTATSTATSTQISTQTSTAVSTATTTATSPTSSSPATYTPQSCNGVFEAAGCGTRIPTGDCTVGGAHQQFAETHCPTMCGLECNPTETTATATATTITTPAPTTATGATDTTAPVTTSTTTTWLGIHDLCDPLKDICDQTKGLVCDGTHPYTCRYDADLGAAPAAVDSGDSGGSNAALYACVGIIGVFILAGGILAVLRCRGARGSQDNLMLNNHHDTAVAISQNPTYTGPFGIDANAAESTYEELGGGSEEATYDEVAGHAVLNNETYDGMGSEEDEDLDC